jgi:hypothetical protein
VAVDPTTGKVFVIDSGNNRVLRFGSLASWTATAAAIAPASVTDANPNNNSATMRSYMLALPLLRW